MPDPGQTPSTTQTGTDHAGETPVATGGHVKVHFKGLNGLRAIAALAVIVCHVNLNLSLFGLKRLPYYDLAGYGVTLFFALSGFLITYLLLEERATFGSISLRSFYYRRILRIWPLYYLNLILCIIILRYSGIPTPGLVYYFVMAANVPNMTGHEIFLLGHYWSIGVEEQFYVFWPLVVSNTRRLGRSLLVFLALFACVKLAAWGVWFWTHGGVGLPRLVVEHFRFHCMAIGGLAAILWRQRSDFSQRALTILFSTPVQLIAWSPVVLAALNRFHVASIADNDLFAVASAVLILNVSCNPRSIVSLENRFFDYLGRISYGIYVYHGPVIFFAGLMLHHLAVPGKWKLVLAYVVVILMSIVVAGLSYEYFEKRFIDLKKRFSPVQSQNSGFFR